VNKRVLHDSSHESALELLKMIQGIVPPGMEAGLYGQLYQLMFKCLKDYATKYDQLLLRTYSKSELGMPED
jgi:hypothetical protein